MYTRIFIAFITFIYLSIATLFFTFSFDLTEYENRIEQSSIELVVGETLTRRDARRNAERALVEIFGDGARGYLLVVYFDEASDVWLAQGMLVPLFVGRAPGILMQASDGTVLAAWFD